MSLLAQTTSLFTSPRCAALSPARNIVGLTDVQGAANPCKHEDGWSIGQQWLLSPLKRVIIKLSILSCSHSLPVNICSVEPEFHAHHSLGDRIDNKLLVRVNLDFERRRSRSFQLSSMAIDDVSGVIALLLYCTVLFCNTSINASLDNSFKQKLHKL